MTDNILSLLIGFDEQARRDRQQNPVFLHRRDRRLALDAQERGEMLDPAIWLAAVQRHQPRDAGAPSSLRRWQRIAGGFALVGAVSGIVTMAGVLAWEGTQRINLTVLLALMLLQLMLGLFTTVQGLLNWQPWHWLQRRLSRPGEEHALGQLAPQLMARAAHTGGLAFTLTALATLLVMIIVQDLAFGWSTTLDTGAVSYHQLVQTLSLPWGTLIPAAVPSLELVEATRFYRVEALVSATDPVRWGQWWPFVAMSWLVYAILPRLLMWLLAQLHLRWRARRLLQDHPDMTALAYRLETPCLDHGNTHNDSYDLPDTDTAVQLQKPPADAALISWAGAGRQQRPESLRQDSIREAGGSASLEEDRQLIDQVGEQLHRRSVPAVTVLVNAWEPPTGDLADFLQLARSRWPRQVRIYLFPLSQNCQHAPARQLLAQWARFVQRLDDTCFALAAVEEAAT